MKTSRRNGKSAREGGQALVLFAIMLTLLLATMAVVIDGGMLRRSSQEQHNALDAGALAGAGSLPSNPTKAASDALKFALANHPGLSAASVTVSFRCLVGDRNGDGQPDAGDVPGTCDPGPNPVWRCADNICVAPSDPSKGQVANTVVVSGTVDTDYVFDSVTGVPGAQTTFESAACSGLCGSDPSVPLDIAFIIDRTSSMSDADLANVQNAALSALLLLDPSKQHVGLGLLGRSQTSANCSGTGGARGLASSSATSGTWVTVPYPTNRSLSSNYQNANGSLRITSQLVRTITCMNHSSTGTNLGDPLKAVGDMLVARGRSGVPKGIILMTDGAANQPDSRSCQYANGKASEVKAMGIEVYTIGFGVAGSTCTDINGAYRNVATVQLLADMASQPTVNNGCTDAENTDGDHFFCEPKSDSLVSVFRLATSALVQGSVRLVRLP